MTKFEDGRLDMSDSSGADGAPSSPHALSRRVGRAAGDQRDEWGPLGPRTIALRRGASDVLGSRTFGTLPNLELHAVALSQISDPFPLDGALMKEVFLPLVVLDEAESLVHSQRTNCSCHGSLLQPCRT